MVSVALIAGIMACALIESWTLAVAFLFKFMTYAASATFHLYPFRSVTGVTSAFIVDLLCIPCSIIGGVVAFVPETGGAVTARREAGVAAAVLVLNVLAVLYQTQGQVGLKTREDRTEAPRSLVTGAYSVWAFIFVGLRTGFDALWSLFLGLTLVAVILSMPVTQAHEQEPTLIITSLWPRRAVWRPAWHVASVWSLHEDFHLVLAIVDVIWLWMVVRWRRECLVLGACR